MRINEIKKMFKTHWRVIRRYFLLAFTAIALLPLALVYLVKNEQFYKIKGFDASRLKDPFADPSFRYPVLLLGKSRDHLTIAATGVSRRRFSKYAKFINETRTFLIPEDVLQTLSPVDLQRVERRMDMRRKYLQSKCSESGMDVIGNDSWHKPNPWEFLVNRKYHIIWCNVFKAASSSWMFNFNVLAGYSPEYLHKTKEVLLSLARTRYPRVTLDKLRQAQNDSITFMIARHPFERLLSAYRDKFVFAVPHSFHEKLGRSIVRKYRKKKGDYSKVPKFQEFVRWLLDEIKEDHEIDMHFVASTKFCTPCLINFDIILKFESLEEDQLYLIEKTGLKRIIAPEWRNMAKGKNTIELLQQFYSQLSMEELMGLYDYYKYDFELFDYNPNMYFDLVKDRNSPTTEINL